jgi:hypothetical protein
VARFAEGFAGLRIAAVGGLRAGSLRLGLWVRGGHGSRRGLRMESRQGFRRAGEEAGAGAVYSKHLIVSRDNIF